MGVAVECQNILANGDLRQFVGRAPSAVSNTSSKLTHAYRTPFYRDLGDLVRVANHTDGCRGSDRGSRAT